MRYDRDSVIFRQPTRLSDLSEIKDTELVNGGVFHVRVWADGINDELNLTLTAQEGYGDQWEVTIPWLDGDIRDQVELALAEYDLGTSWSWSGADWWFEGQFAHCKNWKVSNYSRLRH